MKVNNPIGLIRIPCTSNLIGIFMVTLQTNELPIREIKICDGCCGKQGHDGHWCPNHDYYDKYSIILTPDTTLANAYSLLTRTKILLFEYSEFSSYSETQGLRDKIKSIKKIIDRLE